MRERAELSLKVVCWALVALLLYQTGRALVRNHPFAHVTIPPLPALAANTNAAPSGGPIPAGPGGPLPVSGQPSLPAGTNKPGTNLMAGLTAINLSTATNQGTNLAATSAMAKMTTNAPGQVIGSGSNNALTKTGGVSGTNASSVGTNEMAAAPQRKSHSGHPPMMGMGMGMMGGPGKSLPELPPVVRARIDTIVNSELLGPVVHPLPMALLGIAGNTAFLRAASGETGLVKAGDSLGNLKLLRIGINRVLIELNGQKQELTIFDGMGGDSLLTTSDKNSNETINH